MPHEPRVLWKVVEKHLERVEPAMARFEGSLSSGTMNLATVASGPEKTLLSHIDGLVVGGRRVLEDRILAPLEGDKPPSAALATVLVIVLLHASRPDAATQALFHDSPVIRRAALRGCVLGAGSSLDGWITEKLANAPAGRPALLELAADRGLHVEPLVRSLFSQDPEELVPALRAAWRAPPALYEGRVLELLGHPDAKVRDAAMVTSLHHGSAHGWALCQELAFDPRMPHPFAMALVAGLGEPGQHKRLGPLMGAEAHRPWVIRALGYTGNVGVVPALLFHAQSEDEAEKAGAIEALGTILGPELDKAVAKAKLPGALERWWQQVQGRFDGRRRYLAGHPLTRAAFIQALAHSPMRRRYLLSVLLSIRTGGASRISTSAFSETQRAQLASLGSWKGREEPWTHEFSFF
jgi:hypothetical protein